MKFKKDVRVDAILVHAAMHDLFAPAAIGLGLTATEAFGRAMWLKHQSAAYIIEVTDKVLEMENGNGDSDEERKG